MANYNRTSLGKSWVQVTDEEIIEALIKNGGSTAGTAKTLGTSRNTLLSRIKKSPELRKAQLDAREEGIETIETTLFEMAKEKDFSAIKLYLQSNSPKYSDRLNINMNAITMHVVANFDELEKLYSLEEIRLLNELANRQIRDTSESNSDSSTIGEG